MYSISGVDAPFGAGASAGLRLSRACRAQLHAVDRLWPGLTVGVAGLLSTWITVYWMGRINDLIYLWPVTGVLMAVLLPRWNQPTARRLQWMGCAAGGVLLGALLAGAPGWLAVQTAVLLVLELALTGAMLSPAVVSFNGLKQRAGVLRFALTAISVPLCSAMLGAVTLSTFLHQTIVRTVIQSFFSTSLGIALLYPLGLFLLTARRARTWSFLRQRDALLSLGFFTTVAGCAFWQNTGPFLFIVFPPMIVVLMVMGLEGAIAVSLLLTCIGWVATTHGHGPILLIRNATPEYRLLILQIFNWTSLATAMPVGAMLDERRHAERNTEQARSIYQTMLQHADQMIVLSPMAEGTRHVSASVERLLGWTAEEYLAMDRLATFHPDDRDMAETTLESLTAGKWEHTLRYRGMQKDGGYKWLEATIRAYGDEPSGVVHGYVAAIRDISALRQTEHRWAEERAALTREQHRLANLASTDALTGLENRRAFEDRLNQHEFDMRRQAEHVLALNRSYTLGLRKLTIMMVDVDHFKLYNDTYGHAEGDACLRALAETLRATLCRTDDVAARLGGEEFALVLPGAGKTAALRVAERLLAAVRSLHRPHAASPLGQVTVSIGVAVAVPSTDFSYAHLLQQADRALYQCKRAGRNRAELSQMCPKL